MTFKNHFLLLPTDYGNLIMDDIFTLKFISLALLVAIATLGSSATVDGLLMKRTCNPHKYQ